MKPIRVAIISEHPLHFQSESRSFLQDIENPVWFRNFREVEAASVVDFETIIIDGDWMNPSVLTDLKRLRERAPQAKIIAISSEFDFKRIPLLMRSGVTGILLKDRYMFPLESYIRAVHAGRFVISPPLLNTMVS